MPRHKSAEKRVRQDKRRALRNKAMKTGVRGITKQLRQAKTAEEAGPLLSKCTSLLDKAVKRSVMHRKTADRAKSRLAKSANRLAAGTATK